MGNTFLRIHLPRWSSILSLRSSIRPRRTGPKWAGSFRLSRAPGFRVYPEYLYVVDRASGQWSLSVKLERLGSGTSPTIPRGNTASRSRKYATDGSWRTPDRSRGVPREDRLLRHGIAH